jgi:hypothetical protein
MTAGSCHACDREVLVLAAADEVERLAVDQEAMTVDADGSHAERLRVTIDDLAIGAEHGDLERVQAAGPRRQSRTRSMRTAPSAPSARATSAPSASRTIARTPCPPAVACHGNAVGDRRRIAVYLGRRDRDVAGVGARCRVSVRLIPLALREAAEGHESHERDDEAHPEAPHDHQNDSDDHEKPAEPDAAGASP